MPPGPVNWKIFGPPSNFILTGLSRGALAAGVTADQQADDASGEQREIRRLGYGGAPA
jgi:hypothetical protein